MTIQLQNIYYVGVNQPYSSIRQVINTIWSALESGDYQLPSTSSPDGGNINIVLVGGGQYTGFVIPDNMTVPLALANKYLVIRRQENTEDGKVITDNLPVITPLAGIDLPETDRIIGINLGSNNPNIKLIGLRVSDFIIGISGSFNCNNCYINRCLITNNLNTQIYFHDTDRLYILNSVIVGGQYGIVAQFVKRLRVYHNTIFLDGKTALNQKTKAGIILQGERLFGNTNPSTIYCLGNIVYTIGCPAAIFYDEDLKNGRLVSDYNDFYSRTAVAQLRQDNATLPEDSQQIVRGNYTNIVYWKQTGNLGSRLSTFIDTHSISVHPVFIQNISLVSSSNISSIINLGLIENSPILAKVPSWYYASDSFYIPSDFDSDLISVDLLLNIRDTPFTSIGCNDSKSLNGFFGQDVFTSPIEIDPEKKCKLDPLSVISSQQVSMQYPSINAGYFWSHERPYYLYGSKGASTLGYFAITEFNLPGVIDTKKSISVKVRNIEVNQADWDVAGKKLSILHRSNNITSYDDEVQISCYIKHWYDDGFSTEPAYYLYKILHGKTRFVLPEDYQSSAPVVITDDRISYLNASDIVHREFKVRFDSELQENLIEFGGNVNLWTNGDFTDTISGIVPIGWISKQNNESNSSVFMVGKEYAYWGDHCVALRVNSSPGYIISPTVPISNDDSIALSWHASMPVDITGSAGTALSAMSGAYYINFYNNYDELMLESYSGSFPVTSNSYTRYFISLGSSDQIIDTNNTGVNSASLVAISNTPLSLPDNVTKVELTLSGFNYSNIMDTGAFLMLDAMQAEYGVNPTYFHPRPSFVNMTVEYEKSSSGVFIDNRLNITSIFNENPNGFLYISDMPATIWGGPSDPEVTTLHEYRWPHGRLNVLPWARLFGKDKLHQKVIFNDTISEPKDIIVPYCLPKRAADSVITPSIIKAQQDSESFEGFNLQVLDELGNPFSLRNFVLHTYEDNENFPGWLSKKYMGAKEQLGTTIYGSLSSNGSINGFYCAPSSNSIRYVGPMPIPHSVVSGYTGVLDKISSIETNYKISVQNFGNITIIGENGKYATINGTDPITGIYQFNSNNNRNFITLEYPPAYGTVYAQVGDKVLKETIANPQSNEFYVSYPIAQIEFPVIENTNSIYIEYIPKYAYPNPANNNTVIMHNNKLFGEYSGAIQIDYDASIKMELRVADIMNREYVSRFDVIAQNPHLSKITNTSISIEF